MAIPFHFVEFFLVHATRSDRTLGEIYRARSYVKYSHLGTPRHPSQCTRFIFLLDVIAAIVSERRIEVAGTFNFELSLHACLRGRGTEIMSHKRESGWV